MCVSSRVPCVCGSADPSSTSIGIVTATHQDSDESSQLCKAPGPADSSQVVGGKGGDESQNDESTDGTTMQNRQSRKGGDGASLQGEVGGGLWSSQSGDLRGDDGARDVEGGGEMWKEGDEPRSGVDGEADEDQMPEEREVSWHRALGICAEGGREQCSLDIHGEAEVVLCAFCEFVRLTDVCTNVVSCCLSVMLANRTHAWWMVCRRSISYGRCAGCKISFYHHKLLSMLVGKQGVTCPAVHECNGSAIYLPSGAHVRNRPSE